MAIKNALLGGTDFSTPSDRFKPTDFNDTFDEVANRIISLQEIGIKQIYTGVGFNSSQSGSGTTEGSFELDAISSTDRDFVKVKITGTSSSLSNNSTGVISLKAQIKEIGQSYSDIISYKDILSTKIKAVSGDEGITIKNSYTYEIISELTADMKTNGFQIKVFSESVGGDPLDNSSFTNIQTVVELA